MDGNVAFLKPESAQDESHTGEKEEEDQQVQAEKNAEKLALIEREQNLTRSQVSMKVGKG